MKKMFVWKTNSEVSKTKHNGVSSTSNPNYVVEQYLLNTGYSIVKDDWQKV